MRTFFFIISVIIFQKSLANEADVIAAEAEAIDGDFYKITVTIRHKDQGWDHFVKGWQVLDSNGKVLGTHGLRHPHVNEQPFTRSSTMIIPANVNEVTIRARDSVHEIGGNELLLYINKDTKNETD